MNFNEYIYIMLMIRVLKKVYLCCAAEPPNTEQAVKWLYKASVCGNVRAQYQLALWLHSGGGRVCSNMKEAVGALFFFFPLTCNYDS